MLRSSIQNEIKKQTETIAKNRDGERLQAECRRKNDEIRRNNALIDNSTDKIISSFKSNYRFFFYKKLVADALEVLADADKMDKGIPDIHERTIKFLIQRGSYIVAIQSVRTVKNTRLCLICLHTFHLSHSEQ